MSDKALRMLKHMRQQIVRRTERYVAVREAAISIGVDPGGSECDSLVEELLRAGHLQHYPRAARLKRSTSLWHDSRLDTTGQAEESFRRHARSQTTTDHAHAYSTRDPTAS